MSPLSLLLNLLWIVFGGLWMAVGWLIAAVDHGDHHHRPALGAGRVQHRLLYAAAVRPQGRLAPRLSRRARISAPGRWALLGNLIWLLLAGWWLALGHLITAMLLAVTIIGIPFAWAHLKLAGLALWPIGKMIVEADDMPLRSPQR